MTNIPTDELLKLLRFEMLDRRNSTDVGREALMLRAAGEIEQLRKDLAQHVPNTAALIQAQALLRKCVTIGYSRHEINCFLAGQLPADVEAERKCKGGGKCPEPMWCEQESECLWDRWNTGK